LFFAFSHLIKQQKAFLYITHYILIHFSRYVKCFSKVIAFFIFKPKKQKSPPQTAKQKRGDAFPFLFAQTKGQTIIKPSVLVFKNI
jgi:hypothetical protein